MSVDHVVPRGEAKRLGVDVALTEDFINLVLCCTGCNAFDNRYAIPDDLAGTLPTWPLEKFLEVRDRVFAARTERVAPRRHRELAFFAQQSWLSSS